MQRFCASLYAVFVVCAPLAASLMLLRAQDPKAKAKVAEMANAIREGMKDPVLKHKELDTINASLPSSGMIEAAAQAAEQLRSLFQ